MAATGTTALDAAHTYLSRGRGWTRDLYARARALGRAGQFTRRRAAARRLPDAEPRIAEDEGWALLPPFALETVEPVVRAARALRDATDTSPLWKRSKGRNLLRVPVEPHLDAEPAYLALALDERLLRIVCRYLGTVPLLRGMQLWVSPFAEHSPDGRRLEHLYHCDWADVRQVRVLVFVDDVTEDHGPLTVVPAAASEHVRRARRYRFGETTCVITDEALFAHADPASARPLVGPRGTLAFADTCRCFHQGSRVRRPGLERRMVMFQYLTITGFKLPGRFAGGSPFARHATEAHTSLQRMVLGAD